MRYLPARYRNGYHRTPTRRQRRNRWLLWGTVLALAVVGNRCVASCQRGRPVAEPVGKVRVALGTAAAGWTSGITRTTRRQATPHPTSKERGEVGRTRERRRPRLLAE